MSNKQYLNTILISSLVILFFFIIFYSCHFSKGKLSDNTQDWGGFANYLCLVVSAANTAILARISFMVFRLQSHRDAFEKEYTEAEQKPILTFAVDPEKDQWYAFNAGKGAALNIIIAEDGLEDMWENPRKCYSLAAGQKIYLTWVPGANRLLGIYSDIFPHKTYTSICQGDETTFNFINNVDIKPGHWIQIVKSRATRL